MHVGYFLVVLRIYKLRLVFIRIFIRKSHIPAIKVSSLFLIVFALLYEFLSNISLSFIDINSFLCYSFTLLSNDLLCMFLVLFYTK